MKRRRIALLVLITLPTLLPSACSKAMRVPARDATVEAGVEAVAGVAADAGVLDAWILPADPQRDVGPDSTIPTDAATGAATLGLDRISAQFLAYTGELSAPQVFTVTNRGNAASGPVHVALSGTGAQDFEIASEACSSAFLAMEATCAVTLVFAPTSSLNYKEYAFLTITDSATGASVSATLEGWLCDWGDRLLLSIGPDLGSVTPGTLGAEGRVAVTNIGPSRCGALGPITASVNNLNIAISSNTCTGRQLLTAGETCVVGLRLAPAIEAAPAAVSAVLTVTAAHATVSATVSGKIVSGQPPTANTTSISFGAVPVNQPSDVRTVTLSNYGSTTSDPLSVSLHGTGVEQVSIVANTCNGSIPLASTCVVSVQYLPIDTTGINGTITITDGSASVSIPMVGVGVAAPSVDAGSDAAVDGGN